MSRVMGEIPPTIRKAVNLHCRECNDAHGKWDATNDCTVWKCWLYPYRPGKGGEDRKVRVKSAARVAAGVRLSKTAKAVSQSFADTASGKGVA